MNPASVDDQVVRHAGIIAATRSWLERAVIGLNLCPFAKSVHVRGQVRYVVSAARNDNDLLDDFERELKFLTQVAPAEVDTTLLITPDVLTDFADFTAFLDLAEVVLRIHGLVGVLQVASFHPTTFLPMPRGRHRQLYQPCALSHIAPDTRSQPTKATAALPDAADIYERNMETMRRLGLAGWRALDVEAPEQPKP